ncbi:MAG: RHS repeat-associated core domain-containing protein [Phycisphaerales bacterium]
MRNSTMCLAARCIAFAAIAALAPSASGFQILTTNSHTLTQYQAGTSAVQGLRPIHFQRGVNLDGTRRLESSLGWALSGNPYSESWDSKLWMGNIRLDTLSYSPPTIDLSLPAPGFRWIIARAYNGVQHDGTTHVDSNGYQGWNWSQMSQPELVFHDNSDNTKDALYLVYGADRYIEFIRAGESSDVFKAVNGAAGAIKFTAGTAASGETPAVPDQYTYYDQIGNVTVFFGSQYAGAAAWQFWKMTDPAGNVAYVGDATVPSTAITSGYDSGGRILKAYDTASRRYTYTYSGSTIGGAYRLTQVKAETKSGTSWSSPGTVTEVGRVDYTHYTSDSDDHGMAGDLKITTVTMPLTDSGVSSISKEHYRYYDQSWSDSDGRRGSAHTLKMVLGAEGARNYDATGDGTSTMDDGFTSATDSNLKAYSEVYLEYVSGSDYSIKSVMFNGNCGCSGGVSGTFTFATKTNTVTSNNGYDVDGSSEGKWALRTTVYPPSGTTAAHEIQYFDEVGQPLSHVQCRAIPTTPPDSSLTQTYWTTYVARNSSGQLIRMHWPKNGWAGTDADEVNYDYYGDDSHDDSHTFTSNSSVGLVRGFVRASTGDVAGFPTGVRFQEGWTSTGGITGSYESSTEYTTVSYTPVTGVTIVRPLVSSQSVYPAEGTTTAGTNCNTTSFEYTYYTASGAELMPKIVRTIFPLVATTSNGSGATESKYRYYRKDGTMAFESNTQTASCTSPIYEYTQYTSGQVTKVIKDCRTDDSGYGTVDDPNGAFGITESSAGTHVATTHAYDAQGRLDTTTYADGRIAKEYYSTLVDRRLVHVSIPKSNSGTYYGPVTYRVLNHLDRSEAEGTIALSSSGITTALTSWITESSSDMIATVGVGTLERLTTHGYSSSGRLLASTRVWHTIPSTYGGGVVRTNFDLTSFSYDGLGRLVDTVDPSQTKTRNVYEVRGEVVQKEVGISTYVIGGGPASPPDPQTFPVSSAASDEEHGTGGPDGGNSGTGGTGGDAGGGAGDVSGVRCVLIVEHLNDEPTTKVFRDVRGRAVFVERFSRGSEQPQNRNRKFDNHGRLVAESTWNTTYESVEPTSNDPDRVSLIETSYDERGRVWRKRYHRIAQATAGSETKGNSYDTLDELYWYDADGRLIKVDGASLVKYQYDRMGRRTHVYTLAKDDDASYSNVYDTAGMKSKVDGTDIVLTEQQTTYDDSTDEVLMEATIERFHDSTGTTLTGPLDTNADADVKKYTASDVKGRIQITAFWYDFLHRTTTEGEYGTNAAATFNRSGLSEPSSSSSGVLVTKYRYDGAGELDRVTDPNGRHVVTTFDQAGRVRKTIENYVDGTPGSSEDEDRTTEYTYEYPSEGYGLIRKIIAKRVSSGDDQTTTYKYGVRRSSDYTSSTHLTSGSDINTGNLLGSVVYPQTDGADRIATFKYHQWGLLLKEYKDPAGNTVTMGTSDYDTSRRELKRTLAKASGSAFDDTVTSITRTYGANGKLKSVVQAGGSGDVDSVNITYDGWGNVEEFQQDPISIDTENRASVIVSNSYEKATSGRNTLRRTLQKLRAVVSPTDIYGYEIGFSYSSSGGSHDSDASRVSAVTVKTTGSPVTVAEYDYLGFDHVVGVRYTAPTTDIERKFYGSTSGSYTSFDQFDRLVKDAWMKNGGREFCSLTVAYDSNSNVTSTDDAEPAAGYDVKYTMDNLDRLTRADEGTLSSGSITTGTRDEQWTLSALGNATTHILDLDHNGSYGGTGELNENNADTGSSPRFNKANELRTRDPDNNNTDNITLTYDANGNLTDDGVNYKYEYDTLNRLRRVRDRNDSNILTNLVAEYWYNGLGYRIAMRTDVTGSGGMPDGNADSTDPIYYLVYDTRWRQVATYRDDDDYPKEQFVHHAAGSDGSGSYVDSIILRDRDSDTAWASTADSTREDRTYYCQNRRADVVALVSDSGRILETVKYSAYGVPLLLNPADYNHDGYVNGDDYDSFADDFDNAETAADVNFDGYVNGTDFDDFSEAWDFSGFVAGRGHLSAYNNTFGYAGYTWDPACSRYHVRNRVYAPELGRWLTRDPASYLVGMNLYDYVGSMPHRFADPLGLYGVDDWWEDLKDGWEEVEKTWDEIFDDPSKYTEYAGDDEAIDEVQDALEFCECIPLAEQIVAPINIGLDLIQGDCAGAGQKIVCAAIPGPGGGGGGPLKAVTPGSLPLVPPLKVPSRPPKMKPHPDAQGAHCTLVREGKNQDGPVKKYQEWGEKPNRHPSDPNRWAPGKRYDKHGPPHDGVPTPHVHDDPSGPARPPNPDEIPL